MRVGAVFEEINRVGDDLEAREAFGQARVAVEEMPELVESRLDFLVASLEIGGGGRRPSLAPDRSGRWCQAHCWIAVHPAQNACSGSDNLSVLFSWTGCASSGRARAGTSRNDQR